MRLTLAFWCVSLGVVLLSLSTAHPARGQEKDHHPVEEKGHGPKIEKYQLEKHGSPSTHIDPNNPEHMKELHERLKKGEDVQVKPVKPVNPLEIQADLAIWSVVVFVLLLVVLHRFAWKPMLEGLQKRENTIRGSVDEARLTREEMVRLRDQFKVEMDQAYAKIPQLLDEARREAQKMSEEMRTKAAADIQVERQRMRHDLEVARDQALHELWSQAAQLATLISAKAIGKSLTEEDHRRLLDESLAEMRHAKV